MSWYHTESYRWRSNDESLNNRFFEVGNKLGKIVQPIRKAKGPLRVLRTIKTYVGCFLSGIEFSSR